MEGAVVQDDAQIHHGAADLAALGQHRAEALLARGDELAGNHAAHNLVHELEIGIAHGLDVAGNAAELAGAARLLLVGVVEVRPLGDGLAVGDLRRGGLNISRAPSTAWRNR